MHGMGAIPALYVGLNPLTRKPPRVTEKKPGNYAIFTFRYLLAVKSVQEAANSLVSSYEALSAKMMQFKDRT